MKKRLDQILMERNLFPSREKARSAIMTGRILIKGKKETKAGTMVPEDAVIEMIGNDLPYVSRGGLKLIVINWILKGKLSWILARRPVVLRIVLCKTALQKFMPWMWATVSWRGRFGMMIG